MKTKMRMKTKIQTEGDAMVVQHAHEVTHKVKLPSIRKKSEDLEVQIIKSHRDLKVFKKKLYLALGVKPEYQLALSTKASAIKTIVPNRYLRAAETVANRQRRSTPGTVPFPGVIEILPPLDALKKAYREHLLLSPYIKRLVLWSDGSGIGNGGTAVVYRDSLPQMMGWSRWYAFGFKIKGQHVDVFQMECIGVLKAIDMATVKVKAEPNRYQSISIYTDAQGVLRGLQDKPTTPLLQYVIKKAKALQALGPQLTLHWSPGHSKVRFQFRVTRPGTNWIHRYLAMS